MGSENKTGFSGKKSGFMGRGRKLSFSLSARIGPSSLQVW
jgi:hypothetical protein